MVKITPCGGGVYAIEMNPGPAYQRLTAGQVRELIFALTEAGLILVDGKPARPAS